MVLDNT